MLNGVLTKRYIYFDDDGNLTKVANHNNDQGQYVETELEDVMDIVTGKLGMDQHFVIFDPIEKKHVIKCKILQDDIKFDINDAIYKIPTFKPDRPDLTIVQDIKNKVWKIKLDPALSENIENKKITVTTEYNFSITSKNDPHNLYHYFQIDLNNVRPVAFVSDFELDADNVSVYTTKRFESYYHEVTYE